MNFLKYLFENKEQIITLTMDHLKLTIVSVLLAILIGVPLGILISYIKKFSKPVLGVANIIQAIPSMALLGASIPLLGIGTVPATVMVILYSLLPIIKNTYIGISNIAPETLESARGIGLKKSQILTKIQIPLALPVIMAGVRISAVTAVGLMTMAAFIGASGLGVLVFSGIRTINNNQILAGAIPACILALLIDFLASLVEKLVTPISLQKSSGTIEKQNKIRKLEKITLSAFAIFTALVFVFTSAPRIGKDERVITVAGKDYTEQFVLTSMFAELIEDRTDIRVIQKSNLGGTQVCFSALKAGDIDMYIDYSGTAYGDTLNYPPISDMEEVYTTVKSDFKEKFNIDVLKQIGFNNTYVLAVTKETANTYNLKTMSDLAKVSSELTSGTTFEFLNRKDGLPGLINLYHMNFKENIGLDGSPRYLALTNKKTDVVDAFSTDGLLKKLDLVTLEDDKNFFPPYYAIPLLRNEVLEKYPELVSVIEELGDVLNNDIMIDLNYKVDELQMDPSTVANEFLIESGLISK